MTQREDSPCSVIARAGEPEVHLHGLNVYDYGACVSSITSQGKFGAGKWRGASPCQAHPPPALGRNPVFRAYAKPRTSPSATKMKNTVCIEWTMMPIQALLNRLEGRA